MTGRCRRRPRGCVVPADRWRSAPPPCGRDERSAQIRSHKTPKTAGRSSVCLASPSSPPLASHSTTPKGRARQPYRPREGSDQGDPLGLKALAALDHIGLNALPGLECFQAAAAKRGDVHEDVLAAAFGRDESVALIRLEPFDRALHGLRRAARLRAGAAAAAWRRGGAVVDVENVYHQ